MPEFKGGTDALARFLVENIVFPPEAREGNYSGKTYVNFIVDTNGKILEPRVVRSSGHKCLDEEAIKVVKSMPAWIPGSDSAKRVKVSMNMPVTFKTQGENLKREVYEERLSPEQQIVHDEAMKYYYQGNKLERDGKFNEALEKYNKSLSVESNNTFALFDRAKMLMALGNSEAACEAWNKMLLSNYRASEAQEFLRKYCSGISGSEEIIRELNSLKADGFFDKAMKDVNNGRYEAALHKFDSCLKYKPQHKNAIYYKGLMHFELGQKNLACSSWKRLLEIVPEDKKVIEILAIKCNSK